MSGISGIKYTILIYCYPIVPVKPTPVDPLFIPVFMTGNTPKFPLAFGGAAIAALLAAVGIGSLLIAGLVLLWAFSKFMLCILNIIDPPKTEAPLLYLPKKNFTSPS